MKKIILFQLVAFWMVSLVSCNEDDSLKGIDQKSITAFEFFKTSEKYAGFFEAAEASIITDELAKSFGFETLGADEGGYAIKKQAFESEERAYFSVADILNQDKEELTIFVPKPQNNFEIDMSSVESRAALGNLLLYHILSGKTKVDELGKSLIPLSSGGSDEINTLRTIETDTELLRELVTINFNGTTIEIDNLSRNLETKQNAIIHEISDVLTPKVFTPIPVVIGDIVQQEDGAIAIQFSRDLAELSNSIASQFSLVVEGETFLVTDVVVNPDNLTQLILSTDTKISERALASLSFTSGGLMSEVNGEAASFSDVRVVPFSKNLFVENSGFERGNLTGFVPSEASEVFAISDEIVHSGRYSLKFITNETTGDTKLTTDKLFEVEAGKNYRVSYWIYISQKAPSIEGVKPQINTRIYSDGRFNDVARKFFSLVFSPENEWIKVEKEFMGVGLSGNPLRLHFDLFPIRQNAIFYVDDFSLIEIE